MTRYRLRAVPLLFGVLYLSACFLPRPSPNQLIRPEQIEAEQPLSVLVTKVDQTQVAVDTPFVEGDELRDTIIALRDGGRYGLASRYPWQRLQRYRSLKVPKVAF